MPNETPIPPTELSKEGLRNRFDRLNSHIDQLNSERNDLLAEWVMAGYDVGELLQPHELTQGGPVELGRQIENY